MNINSSFSLSELNYDIPLENKKENKQDNIITFKINETNEISLNIKNISNFNMNKTSLSFKELDKKINILNDIKSVLNELKNEEYLSPNNASTISIEENKIGSFNFDKLLENIPNNIKKEELDQIKEFLNPNQKFFSQSDKDTYLSKMNSLDISITSLSNDEKKVFFENSNKAISNDFDKRNDFDLAIDTVYFFKQDLQKSNSLNDKSKIDNQLDILHDINQKLLLSSKNSTSLDKKESLVKEIKDLLKNFDKEFENNLSNNLDEIINKNNEQLGEFSNKNISISSFDESKDYLEKMDKLDVNFDTLSFDEKKTYIENKQKILDMLKTQESIKSLSKYVNENSNKTRSLSEINDSLNTKIEKVLKIEKDEINELSNARNVVSSLEEAKDFLEKNERRKSSINNMSESHKSSNSSNLQLAKQFIESNKNNTLNKEIDIFIGNIDNLIDVLNDTKSNIDSMKDDIKYNKKNLDFESLNLRDQKGSFLISQSTNIDASNVYRLIS